MAIPHFLVPALLLLPVAADVDASEVSTWVELLNDPDPQFRGMGAKELAMLGPKAAPAIPELIEVLGDTRAGEATPAIAIRTRTVRDFAIRALTSVGSESVPPLIQAMLNHSNAKVRVGAAQALTEFVDPEKPQPQIRQAFEKALRSSDEELRRQAARGLAEMGLGADVAVETLIGVLQGDCSWKVRFEIVRGLPQIDPDGDAVLDAITAALEDENPNVRAAAAQAVDRFGAKAKTSVPALVELLDDDSLRWRTLAPDMIEQRPVRIDAAQALGAIGPAAENAIPALKKLLGESVSGTVRVAAALALKRIDADNEQPMSVLIGALEADETGTAVPQAAARALQRLGPDARPAVPALLRVLEHSDSFVRAEAARALGAIGDASARPGLVDARDDPDRQVREAAEKALEELETEDDSPE